mgnify:FL=1
MDIIRHCKCCGKQFIAHRMTTLYCSKVCNRKATTVQKKESIQKEFQSIQNNLESSDGSSAIAEFLSPAQAAKLLGVSRATLYRYALAGVIKAVQFKGLTIIRKSDIEKAFDNAPEYKKRIAFSKKKEDSEYYTTREISEKYHITRKVILKRCERFNIPKVYDGRNTFFKKVYVDVHFAELIEEIDLCNYYTIEQTMEKLGMSRKNTISYVSRNNIPRINRGRYAYYSKVHIDNCKRKGEDVDPNWYSYSEIMAIYGLSKDQISYHIRQENIKIEKRGKFTMIFRTEFDQKVIKGKFGDVERDEQTGKFKFANDSQPKVVNKNKSGRVEAPATPDGYFSTEDISKKYSINVRHVQKITREARIPKISMKGFNFFEIPSILALFGASQIDDGIKEWITPEEMEKQYNMTAGARRSFTHRHKIPAKVEFGKMFYSKSHIDKVKHLDFNGKENYYSVQEVMDKYELTKDMVFYYSNKKKVTKVKCGQQVYLLKTEIDEYMAERAQNSELLPITDD